MIGASPYEEAVLPLALQKIGRTAPMPADVTSGGASKLPAGNDAGSR